MVVAVKEGISNEIDFKTIPLSENIEKIVMFDESNGNIFYTEHLTPGLYILSNKNGERSSEVFHKHMLTAFEGANKILVLNEADTEESVQILDLQDGKLQDINYKITNLNSTKERNLLIDKYGVISLDGGPNNPRFFNLEGQSINQLVKDGFKEIYGVDTNNFGKLKYQGFGWFKVDISHSDTEIVWFNIDNISKPKKSKPIKTIGFHRIYGFDKSELTIMGTTGGEKYNKNIRKIYNRSGEVIFPIGEEGIEFVGHHGDRARYGRNKMVIFDNNDKKLKVIKFDNTTIEIIDSDFKKTIDNKNGRIFGIRKSSVKYFSPIEGNFVGFDPEQIKENYTEAALKYNILFDLEGNIIQNEKERNIYWEPFQFNGLWSRSDETKGEYSLFNSIGKEIINTETDFGKKFIAYIRNNRLNYPNNFVLGKKDDKKFLINKNSVLDDAEILDNNQLKIGDKNFLLKNFPWDGKIERKEIKNLGEDIEINGKIFKKKLTKFKI